MFPTAISLDEKTRFEVCKILQQLLAEASNLHLWVRVPHWVRRAVPRMPLRSLARSN